MTLHLRRLCVGIDSIDHLARVQAQRLAGSDDGRLFTYTRMTPRRAAELVDGGSLFWIIRGVMRVRQAILGVETDVDPDGRKYCKIHIDPELVPVRGRPHKAFQGWRYFKPEDAPPDARGGAALDGDLPAEMAEELRDLGLL